jgi:predicted Zn-dependent protease with MMP-like domain
MPLRYVTRGVATFTACVRASVARIEVSCPRALVGLDIGFEDVPSQLAGWVDRVPLASAVGARPLAGSVQKGRIVLYRRPIEHRASNRRELAALVHRTVLEQLSAITGISLNELDPTADRDWED